MKKILFIISSIQQNGPSQVLLNIMNGIDKNKFKVDIFTFLKNDKEFIKLFNKNNVEIIEMNYKKKIDILIKGKRDLNRNLYAIKPDIVHSHGILPDIINIKSKSEIKITTIHNNPYEDYMYSFGRIMGKLYLNWHLFYLKKFDKCICCSKAIYDVMNVKLQNSIYIRNAIFEKEKYNLNNYIALRNEVREEYNIPNNALVYIYIGGINERKNVKQLVYEFNRKIEDDEYFFIIGDGKNRKEIETINNNKKIIFCGFQNNIKRFLCAADIYCSFSKSEGFSISVLEALEYNNLLLLSDIPSHKEIFEIDPNLYIGENFSIDDFGEKKDLIRKHFFLKNNDSKNILYKYLNCNIMSRNYEEVYEKLCIEKRRRNK